MLIIIVVANPIMDSVDDCCVNFGTSDEAELVFNMDWSSMVSLSVIVGKICLLVRRLKFNGFHPRSAMAL